MLKPARRDALVLQQIKQNARIDGAAIRSFMAEGGLLQWTLGGPEPTATTAAGATPSVYSRVRLAWKVEAPISP
jgi:hypothetical protein